MCYHHFVTISMCVSSFVRGQAGWPGSDQFRIAHVTGAAGPLPGSGGGAVRSSWGLYVSSTGLPCPLRRHPLAVFIFVGDFPTHQAGMTEVYLRVSRAGMAGFSCSRYFFAQTPKGFEDISKPKGEQRMKYRAVWKPGGRPRRGMGSMKPGRRQLQALKPRGAVFGKGAKHFDASGIQAA